MKTTLIIVMMVSVVIVGFLIVTLAIYGLFSFAYADLDPLKWSAFGRGLFAWVVLCAAISMAKPWFKSK